MAGLLDKEPDEDDELPTALGRGLLDSMLMDRLYGTRTRALSKTAGPFDASYIEQQPSLSVAPADPAREPHRTFDIGVGHKGDNFSGRLGVMLQQDPGGGRTISPGVNVGVGPLSFSAALDHQFGEGGTTTPRFGAAIGGPLFGGEGSASFSITPNLVKTIAARFNVPLDVASEIALQLSHTMPQEGRPDTRFGVAYRRRF